MTTPSRYGLQCAAMLAGVVVAVLLTAGWAGAAVGARATGNSAVTTTSWAATLVTANGTVLTGQPLKTSYTVLSANYLYASVRNTGTTALSAQTYALTTTGTLGAAALDACVGGTWQTTTNTCTGNVVRITADNTSGPRTAITLTEGSSVGLRITLPPPLVTATVSLSVSTSRADIRPATTIHS